MGLVGQGVATTGDTQDKQNKPPRSGNHSERSAGPRAGGRNRRRRKPKPVHEDQQSRLERLSGNLLDTGGDPGRPVFSAIDLGTNNCRLLVARPTRSGFRIIDAFSRVVRLGEGIGHDSVLTTDAMDRTVEALAVCAEKLKRRRVTHMKHVATEACRVASNAPEFLDRVKSETGINIEVITAADEARLAVAGCQTLITPNHRYALVFDIGGGSTELVWVRIRGRGRYSIIGWTSIPWGVVNLTERFGCHGKDVQPDTYAAMIDEVRKGLVPFFEKHNIQDTVSKRRVQFLGTSGTVTTLASLHFELPRYDRNKIDGAWLKPDEIRDLARNVAAMTHKERVLQPCIGGERADLVIAGCAILDAIMDVKGLRSLRVADRGIREGILRSLMKDAGQRQQKRQPRHKGPRKSQGRKTS